MDEVAPHPLPTWREFLAVQVGRWFFAKWMLSACLAAGIATGILALQMPVHYTDAIFALAIGLAQGWPLFGWGWRTWVWCAAWFAAVSMGPDKIHLIFLGLGVVQSLLLLGCRQRFVLWLGVSQAGLEAFWWFRNEGAEFLRGWVISLHLLFSIPPWINPFGMAISLGLCAYFMILGAALAWLMPPKEAVPIPRDSP